MDTLYLSLFLSFTESSWEAAAPHVLSLDVVSQKEFYVLGTPHLGMASIDWFPDAAPSITHSVPYVDLPHGTYYYILFFLVLEDKVFLPSFSFFRVYNNDVIFSSFYSLYL